MNLLEDSINRGLYIEPAVHVSQDMDVDSWTSSWHHLSWG